MPRIETDSFHHTSPEQAASRAFTCALTIACGYFLGGFIPLLPYFLVGIDEVMQALWWSLGVMLYELFYLKVCRLLPLFCSLFSLYTVIAVALQRPNSGPHLCIYVYVYTN